VYEATRFVLPDGPYETLAGFVLHRLGRIPEPTAMVDHEGWRIEVLGVDGRRIVTLLVVEPPDGPSTTAPGGPDGPGR
jgi:putative hemolysin